MKKLLTFCLVISFVFCFVGCNDVADNVADNVADTAELDMHKVTMTNPDWLYEKLKSHYRAGGDVIVKISMATDLGTIFLVNGKPLKMETYNSDEGYWQYRFTMPDEDVVIDFKTYDGFLAFNNEDLLIETYWIQNLDADYVTVRTYYGEYESGAVVAMIDSGDYTLALWNESVGPCTFEYNDGNRITVLYDGVFYTLGTAYEKGYLTDRDLEDISSIHKGEDGIRHKIEGYGTSKLIDTELLEKYYPGDELIFKVETTEAFMPHLFINDVEIRPELIKLSDGYVQFRFIMPDADVDCNVEYVKMEGWQ